jgi:hypothetical protein
MRPTTGAPIASQVIRTTPTETSRACRTDHVDLRCGEPDGRHQHDAPNDSSAVACASLVWKLNNNIGNIGVVAFGSGACGDDLPGRPGRRLSEIGSQLMGSVAGVQNADYSRPCGLALLLLGVEALGSAALNTPAAKSPSRQQTPWHVGMCNNPPSRRTRVLDVGRRRL